MRFSQVERMPNAKKNYRQDSAGNLPLASWTPPRSRLSTALSGQVLNHRNASPIAEIRGDGRA